ncbi:hypothetical protein Ais01nite_49380 [Asanoa ishikariensis]|uniref:Lipoprotein n=1 Tax=Asanoa ishikariensis TaxID=137265 RepID=A0A1H3RRP6_9ACTN|nr:hypothetical protein [Asanoa ishikariensis]GIF66903.1 hypothetical protein Ais01nite_49380 [Asanoa ishikariensis]SDZ28376.1 hypothetical protein SAMN05421684_4143 [Asanoa ishikariensis]
MLLRSRCCPTYLAVAAVVVLAVTACDNPEATTGGAAPTTPPATTAGAPAAAGPMTGAELVWLEGVAALHRSMDDVLSKSPTALSPAAMRTLAKQLGGCTSALDKLGPPTDRLRPVHELAGQGCAEYKKGGDCFTTAAGLGVVVAGSKEEKQQTDAITCGFSAPGEGSRLLAEAEGKGMEVKAGVG